MFSFTDQNLHAGTSYSYRMLAFNYADLSAYSDQAGARTTEGTAQKSLRQRAPLAPE